MTIESSSPGPRQGRPSGFAFGEGRFRGLALFVAIAAMVWVAVVVFDRNAEIDPALDEDLCPGPEEIAASASFLVDLRKPLDPAHRTLPGKLLRDWSVSLAAGTELRLYAVAGRGDAPRVQIGRMCKPYANTDLDSRQAKDQRVGVRDCDDVPAQVAPDVRAVATRFCAIRDEVAAGLDALASASDGSPVQSAHLIEALEATVLEFEERPAPHSLYVFSDLLHHAQWYSHFDLGWQWWRFEDFSTMREQRRGAFGPRPQIPDMQVTLLYFARLGLSDQPRPKRALRRFWREYFNPAQPSFEEQPTMAGYAFDPLMGLQTEADQAFLVLAQERTRLEAEADRQARETERLADLEAELLRREQRLQVREAAPTDAPRQVP